VQTIRITGAGDRWGKEFVDNGSTSDHHINNPLAMGGGTFSDEPDSRNGSSFKAVVLFGSGDAGKKTFTAHTAFTYGFSVSQSGQLTLMKPRAATKAELTHALTTTRNDSHGWTIN
jgi:hypothetical protein